MLERAADRNEAEKGPASDCPVIRPVAVEPREAYRIWLRYSDGAEGEVDLSHLVGKGVFEAWRDQAFFSNVRLTEYDSVAWDEDLELCPDALYLELTGKSLAELMPHSVEVLSDS